MSRRLSLSSRLVVNPCFKVVASADGSVAGSSHPLGQPWRPVKSSESECQAFGRNTTLQCVSAATTTIRISWQTGTDSFLTPTGSLYDISGLSWLSRAIPYRELRSTKAGAKRTQYSNVPSASSRRHAVDEKWARFWFHA